ncbi:hypothetical protein, partial [Porphyromonas sp.]|uniref:hypothetical protein n=1 Tax=Porphyromonas sp. TaxID=1924944 RepID=UPI0025D74D9D
LTSSFRWGETFDTAPYSGLLVSLVTTSEGALPANVQVAPPRGGLSARRSALAERCAVVSVTVCPRLAERCRDGCAG